MTTISMEKTASPIRELIQTALKGEEIIITRNGKPVIQWVVIKPSKPRRQPGSAKHLNIQMSEDFDEPLEDFAEYM